MNNDQLGRPPAESDVRDAIHIAIAPVTVAAHRLRPGQHVGLDDDGKLSDESTVKRIGVVDPFLQNMVKPGEACWLLLYPNTITSLAHVWTHPDFPDAESNVEPDAESVAYLEVFACAAGMSYETLIQRVAEYCVSGHPWVERGSEQALDAYYKVDPDEFWLHFQRATGLSAPEDFDWSVPFSCSC